MLMVINSNRINFKKIYGVIVRPDRTIQDILKILDSPIKSGNDRCPERNG